MVTDAFPAACDTVKLEAVSSTLPTGGAASPAIVTPSLPGLPMAAPVLGLDSATVKVLLPENGVAFMTPTEKLFGAVSPLAHCSVPLAGAKSVPASAVPLGVEYATPAGPVEPPIRLTEMGNV